MRTCTGGKAAGNIEPDTALDATPHHRARAPEFVLQDPVCARHQQFPQV